MTIVHGSIDTDPKLGMREPLKVVYLRLLCMDEETLHYLGGIIDADGSVRVSVAKVDAARYGFSIQPDVNVAGGHERHRIFRELVAEVKGTSDSQQLRKGNVEWEETQVSGTAALKVIKVIAPYLREKEPIARRILEEDWDGNRNGQIGRSPEQYKALVDCREDIGKMLGNAGRRHYDREDLLTALDGEA